MHVLLSRNEKFLGKCLSLKQNKFNFDQPAKNYLTPSSGNSLRER
jgi:hypothetical protein